MSNLIGLGLLDNSNPSAFPLLDSFNSGYIPKEPEKSALGLGQSPYNRRSQIGSYCINTNLFAKPAVIDSSELSLKPKNRFFRWFGYMPSPNKSIKCEDDICKIAKETIASVGDTTHSAACLGDKFVKKIASVPIVIVLSIINALAWGVTKLLHFAYGVMVICMAQNNNLQMVEGLLKKGPILQRDREIALLWAISFNNLRMVIELINNGPISLKVRDKALLWAVLNNHLQMVITLLNKGSNSQGAIVKALARALRNKNLQMIQVLIQERINLESPWVSISGA